MIKQYKNGYIINLTDAVISQYETTKKKNRHTLSSEHLKWKPCVVIRNCLAPDREAESYLGLYRPVFTRSQLAFGF